MSFVHAFLAAAPSGHESGDRSRLPTLLDIPDRELLARLRGADAEDAERVFDIVYRAFHARLVSVARPYVGVAIAEELVQDVFSRVWERRTTLMSETPLGIYLYAATRNAAISVMRHDRVVGRVEHVAVAAGDALAMGTSAVSPADTAQHQEVLAALSSALGSLPEGMRTAFTLRWIHELSYPEVAAIMGIAEPAVRKQVSRAREAILPVLRKFAGD